MAKKTYQAPRGTRDILPEDQVYFDYLEKTFESIIKTAGFQKITTPIFEETELFIQGVGKGTEIVDREMYTFDDKSRNSLTLRPEGTSPIVRAYLENGMQSWSQPVKLYYYMPMYRYDRPQAGRYREHWQFGLEMIGDEEPIADVTVILSAQRVYKKLGLWPRLSLQLNSIGCSSCRPKYIKELREYYKDNLKKVCSDCKTRYKGNLLRLLDCKERKCQTVIEEAPQIINFLCRECHDHFKEVLELLDEINVVYEINPCLVRGLDYYTKTVFEFWTEKEGAQNSLGGGGRYDGLIEALGGKPTPGLGFAGGVDRTVEYLKNNPEVDILFNHQADVFVAQLGDNARKSCLKLLCGLWDEEIIAEGCLDKGGISEQLSMANRLKVKYTLIIGQKEAFDETVIIKEMSSGNQEIYPQNNVVREIKKRLK
jgi:histidyl-tRNA synthetase